jgi:hypothetical protein
MTQRDGMVDLTVLHCRHRKGRPRSTALVYRRDMPGRKRPTAEDAMTARRMLLDGLARDADIFEVPGALAALHPRNDTFPTGTIAILPADSALESCQMQASREGPISAIPAPARP